MNIERILVVFNNDGTIKGIASYAPNGAAVEMSEEDFLAALPEIALLAQIQDLTTRCEAAELAVTAAEADRDEKVASAEAAKVAAEVDRDAKVSELEARVAELTAVPERVIHKAYLRAALASIDKLAEVDAAVTIAGVVQWELWANATTISQDDPDVNEIATALNIDLDAVFEIARSIRSARENK